MDKITKTLIEEMRKYVVDGFNSFSYMTENPSQRVYTVVTTVVEPDKRYSFTDLYARVVDDKIIIEHDANNKTLYEALMQAGIRREQIVLAYAGEPVPDAV